MREAISWRGQENCGEEAGKAGRAMGNLMARPVVGTRDYRLEWRMENVLQVGRSRQKVGRGKVGAVARCSRTVGR